MGGQGIPSAEGPHRASIVVRGHPQCQGPPEEPGNETKRNFAHPQRCCFRNYSGSRGRTETKRKETNETKRPKRNKTKGNETTLKPWPGPAQGRHVQIDDLGNPGIGPMGPRSKSLNTGQCSSNFVTVGVVLPSGSGHAARVAARRPRRRLCFHSDMVQFQRLLAT